MRSRYLLAFTFVMCGALPARAQLRATSVLTLDGARNIVAASEEEAKKNNWSMSVAIVDASGGLVLFHKGDGSRPSNVDFALAKARTAARFQRATKTLDSAVTAGRLQWLAVDALPIEGGVPIIVDGQIIGAVGVSGGTAAQDAQVASAGIAALKTAVVR
ncbi:MAG: heme-binding protein [bacterium]